MMLRIDRHGKALILLKQKSIPEVGLKERTDIQSMIRSSPGEFFAEMGEKLILIGEEVRPTEVVDDRIDLLAIDERGVTVVIELKRGSHKLHLLQTLGYAATIAAWEPERLVQLRAQLVNKSTADVEEEFDEFLSDEAGTVNQEQRIVLIAEDFDYMVLVTAEWLTEKYGLDIRCHRLALSAEGDQEFLTCTCIYPPPELAHAAVRRRGKRSSKPGKWATWEDALAAMENTALVEFYRKELNNGQQNGLPRRSLIYRAGGRRRLSIYGRRKLAYVWQTGRFEGDVEFWREQLSNPDEVKPVKEGRNLRFFLSSANDFQRFGETVRGPFQHVQFLQAGGEAVADADDND